MSALGSGYDFFNYYFVLVVTPMFMLCGVFYPIDTLPPAMHGLVYILPLTHAVELNRPLVTGQTLTEPTTNIAVLTAYTLATYYLAVVLVRKRLLV